MYFYQLLRGWKKQERFPGFGYGVPAMLLVWTIGGTVCILQNWFFVLFFYVNFELCYLSILASIFSILIAVILGFKAGNDRWTGKTVQKVSAFLTRYKIAFFTVIVLLIAASVVGQQIYYRTSTRFPYLTKYLNHQVYWNYFAFFHTSSCPFDKFQKLEYICVTRHVDFSSIPATSSIKELQFQGSHNLTENDIKRLAQFPSLERLELIYWNDLKDSDSSGLECLSQIKGLKELTLDVTTRSVDDIPKLKDIPNLEKLCLYLRSSVFFEVETDYASLQSAPKLKTLILAFPYKVDEAEIQRARAALPNCKIEAEDHCSNYLFIWER